MVKFIHLSDLHISKNKKKTHNQNAEQVVNHICSEYEKDGKDLVVLITGDIVDDGEEAQYENAVEIISPLANKFTVLACPGNHDYGPCGNFYTENAQAMFQKYILGELLNNTKAKDPGTKMEELYPMVDEISDVLFVGIDSVVDNEDEFAHFASGGVGSKQRNALAKILKTNSGTGRKIVVYFHHHPLHYREGIKKPFMKMDDADKVLRILATQTDVVCFGHRHVSQALDSTQQDFDIDWILAAGKSNDRNRHGKFQYREIIINGEDNVVSKISFRI